MSQVSLGSLEQLPRINSSLRKLAWVPCMLTSCLYIVYTWSGDIFFLSGEEARAFAGTIKVGVRRRESDRSQTP